MDCDSRFTAARAYHPISSFGIQRFATLLHGVPSRFGNFSHTLGGDMRFGVHAVTMLTDASAFIDGRCFDGSVSVGCVFSILRTRAGKIEAIALADATAPHGSWPLTRDHDTRTP